LQEESSVAGWQTLDSARQTKPKAHKDVIRTSVNLSTKATKVNGVAVKLKSSKRHFYTTEKDIKSHLTNISNQQQSGLPVGKMRNLGGSDRQELKELTSKKKRSVSRIMNQDLPLDTYNVAAGKDHD